MPQPNLVNISGNGELTAFKDVAKVSLLVTTEARTLNEAMSVNQALRLSMIEDFVNAGIPATAINNSKFPPHLNLVYSGAPRIVSKWSLVWR